MSLGCPFCKAERDLVLLCRTDNSEASVHHEQPAIGGQLEKKVSDLDLDACEDGLIDCGFFP